MKRILVSCFILLSLTASSQNMMELTQKAIELYQQEDYENTIPAAEKAAEAIRQFLGEDSLFYSAMVKIQAISYYNTFQYGKAEAKYLHLLEVVKKNTGGSSESYTACLNNLSNVYEAMGKYKEAESLLLQVKDITFKTRGEYDNGYTVSLNNLAALYQTMGLYQQSEPLYILARDIRKRNPGENSAEYANSINNLATLYAVMGQYNKAGEYYQQAKDIRKKVLGENHPDYAASLNNIASNYEDKEDYASAEPLYIEAAELRKKLLGESHPDYATSLNNLAGLYTKRKEYEKAEALMIKAMETWKTQLGETHPNYALSLNNLAALYRRAGIHYDKAETYYRQALALRKKILGDNHPLCADTENDLGLLYMDMGLYEKAAPHLRLSSKIMMQNLLNGFSVLSEKEKSNLVNYNATFTACNNSLLYRSQNAAFVYNSLDLQLFYKSVSLADTRNMLEALRESKDSSIRQLFTKWQANKLLLSKQYALPVAGRLKNLKQREEETESMEKELNRKSFVFRDQHIALQITAKDIQNKLRDDEAAVEFVSFRLYHKGWTDSILYGAYIFRGNDTAAQFVPLFEEKELQQLCISAGRSATGTARSFYQANGGPYGDQLYALVWKPIEPFLQGIHRIVYSPAGKLYGIAFHALHTGKGILLMDKYQLQPYVSTRQVALRSLEQEAVTPEAAVLFGNPDFSMDRTEIMKPKKNQQTVGPAKGFRGGDGLEWPGLPGTEQEVKEIDQLFKQHNRRSQVYLQQNATEESLKQICLDPPQVLHIATHGFYQAPKLKKPEMGIPTQQEDDPLLRSGLILAGGNYVWKGNTPVEGVEDGIVTAFELAQLDLEKTQLVVLSACETALGDVQGTEGVFGLQRAFKMAGAKKMILSLWKVPDKETAELMTSFYSHWIKGKLLKEAFKSAQADMRSKYTPFYWAAFVLVE